MNRHVLALQPMRSATVCACLMRLTVLTVVVHIATVLPLIVHAARIPVGPQQPVGPGPQQPVGPQLPPLVRYMHNPAVNVMPIPVSVHRDSVLRKKMSPSPLSMVMRKTPRVARKMPRVIQKAPRVMQKAPRVMQKAPRVMQKAPRLMQKTSRVIQKTSRVMQKTSRVMQKAPKVVQKVPPLMQRHAPAASTGAWGEVAVMTQWPSGSDEELGESMPPMPSDDAEPDASPLPSVSGEPWQDASPLPSASDELWEDASPLPSASDESWEDASPLPSASDELWQDASPLPSASAEPWQYVSPLPSASGEPWQHASPLPSEEHAAPSDESQSQPPVLSPGRPHAPAACACLVADTACDVRVAALSAVCFSTTAVMDQPFNCLWTCCLLCGSAPTADLCQHVVLQNVCPSLRLAI